MQGVKDLVLHENASGKKKCTFPMPKISGDEKYYEEQFLMALQECFVDCKITTKNERIELLKDDLFITIDWT